MSERTAEFESLLMELSRCDCPATMALAEEEAKGILRKISDFLDAAFVVIVLQPETGTDFSQTFASGGAPPDLVGGFKSVAVQHWINAQMHRGEIEHLSDVSAASFGVGMAPDPFAAAGIRSLYLVPLWKGGEVFGGLVCGFCHRQVVLSGNELRRAQCLGQVVGHRWLQADRNERLGDAVEAAEAGLWALDLESMTYWATDTARKLHGFAVDDIVGLDMVLDKIHPDDRAIIQGANTRAAAEPGCELRVEYRVMQPDGGVRWMLARGRSDLGPGMPRQISGIVSDISERKNAEIQLRDARALTDAVFDSVPGLIYLYAQDGRLVRWNRRHEVVSGYSADELEDFSVTRWFDESDIPRLTREWTRVFEEGWSSTELPLKMKDGSLVLYFFTGVRVEINGRPHMVGIGIDVAEQKRAESSLAELRNELAHATRVTTLGELVSALVHEMSQPLAAILSNAQAARRLLAVPLPDLEEVKDALEDIVRDDKRAGAIVHGLRAMMAKGEVSSQLLDINSLVRLVMDLLNSELVATSLVPALHLGTDLPLVNAGQIEVQHVLLNLVVNAIDAQRSLPADERSLRIDTFSDSRVVNIAVRDSGGGLPQEALSKVFEPFFTTKVAGLGMGLAICRRIVETYRGRIWAENNADRGATFYVELPAERSESS